MWILESVTRSLKYCITPLDLSYLTHLIPLVDFSEVRFVGLLNKQGVTTSSTTLSHCHW
jgi:hypothetical protein